MYLEPELKHKILAVFGNKEDVELLGSLLSPNEYEITWASEGSQGIDFIHNEPPDLIIIGIHLPDISSYDLCRSLKDTQETMFIPIILVSSLSDVETEIKGIEAGVDDYLIKPFHEIVLKARIKSLLKLHHQVDELENAETVLFTLALSVEAKDPYTENHCQRLSKTSVNLGSRLGLPEDQLKALGRGGFLHDIGKVATPDAILLKPGKLTSEEWGIMQQHPIMGEKIVKPMKSMKLVLPIIRHHHERWDGSGYPDHLKKEEIPLLARILQLADIYDALRTARPYKRAFPKELSLSIIKEETKKGWYDPELAIEFLKMKESEERDYLVTDEAVHSSLTLSSGSS